MIPRYLLAGMVMATLILASPVLAGPGSRDLSPPEYERLISRVMAGRAALAAQELEALADTCAGRPLYLLARARLLLEAVPLDDEDKTRTEALLTPLYPLLDQVVAFCDAGLEQDPDRQDLVLFRGWSWMVRSQAKAYERSFYAAGRDAGRGKNDLEDYLEAHPGAPIASGLLGAFLYFTDAVPELFQFLSRLLFLPTGDRERGLALIRAAVEKDSPARVDYQVLDARVRFFFEGRYEEGLDRNNSLLARYPNYPRLAVASATMAALDPVGGRDHLTRSGDVIRRLENKAGVDTASLATLRALQGWSTRLMGGHDAARELLTPMAASPPAHPDWAGAFARLQLAEMAALEGREDEARRLARQIGAEPASDRFRERASRLLDDLSDGAGAEAIPDSWVRSLYAGQADSVRALIPRLDARAAASIQAAFLAADARLLSGDERGASRGYRSIVSRDHAAWERVYRFLAAARLGEVAAARGNHAGAARWLDRAVQEGGNLEGLEWAVQGRKRYFEEIRKCGRAPQVAPFMNQGPAFR